MSKIIIYLKINKSLAKRGIEEVSRTAIYKAVHRSQDLGFERSAPVEKARASACTRDKIEEYVNSLRVLHARGAYDNRLVFNIDETWIRKAPHSNKLLVITSAEIKSTVMETDPTQKHMTVMPCICADGSHCQAQLIVPTKTVPEWYIFPSDRATPNFFYCYSQSGWQTEV